MEGSHLNVGERAPDFQLADLNGNSVALADFREQVTIVNFWSAECPWSERVDRELQPALARWGSAVALIDIAANASEPLENIRAVSQERALPRVLVDPHQEVVERFGAITTPHLFVIDREGILRYQGAFDDVRFRQRQPSQAYLIPVVEALLAGKAPEPPLETPSYGCAIVRAFEA